MMPTLFVHSSDMSLVLMLAGLLGCVAAFSYGVVAVAVKYVSERYQEQLQAAQVKQGVCPDCSCRFDGVGVIQHGHFVQEHEPEVYGLNLNLLRGA